MGAVKLQCIHSDLRIPETVNLHISVSSHISVAIETKWKKKKRERKQNSKMC